MNVFELTKRNIRRSFHLYMIYLVSMIIGVMIHFTFSSLMFNKDILESIRSISNFQIGVTVASIVVFFFIIFFMLYCNSFFMKQRKKEFGMYLLLGLSEKQITFMIFYETVIIGFISLGIGIITGGLLSKLFGMILMNLMNYESVISLSFPIQAIAVTIFLFLLLAVIISIQSYFAICKVQLVELFHAKEKADKPFKTSAYGAISSIFLLGTAFVLISRGLDSVVWKEYTAVSMIAVTVGIIGGTYLFFREFISWWLKVIRNKKDYYKGNRVLWASSLRFQLRGNTLNLTFITLSSVVTMMLMAFVLINYKVQLEGVRLNVPNDIAFQSLDEERNNEILQLIKDSDHEIKSHLTLETLVVTDSANMESTFDRLRGFSEDIFLVSESVYNEIVSLRGDNQLIDLQENEGVALSHRAKKYEEEERPLLTVGANDEEVLLSLTKSKEYVLLGRATDVDMAVNFRPSIIIVSDEVYQELSGRLPVQAFEIYQLTDSENAVELSRDIHAIVTSETKAYYSAFVDLYSIQIESSALLLFSMTFLAVIALFALANIIYFKQLREATEEQEQYTILRKMGVGNEEIKSVIKKKLFFVFFPPLILGISFSWLMIKYFLLDSLQGFSGLISGTLFVFACYFIVYVLLYLSSVKIYYKIVQQKF